MHQQHPPAEQFHVRQQVGGDQHCAAFAGIADQGSELLGGEGVQPRAGLVQEQDVRFVGQHAGQPQAHPLAPREPVRQAPPQGGQPEALQQGLALGAGQGAGALQAGEEGQVLGHRHLGVEGRLLRQPADVAAQAAVGGQRPAQHLQAAAHPRQHPGERRQGAGLAGAVDAQQRHHLAAPQAQVQSLEARRQGQAAGVEYRFHGRAG